MRASKSATCLWFSSLALANGIILRDGTPPLLASCLQAQKLEANNVATLQQSVYDVVNDISAEPSLEKMITVGNVHNAPVEEMLTVLSKQSGVTLTAARPMSDQRVNVYVPTTRPVHLHQVMARLLQVLSHNKSKRTEGSESLSSEKGHYYWERERRLNGKGATVTYRLNRDNVARRQEREERDAPARMAFEMVRDWRNLLRQNPDEREAYKGNLSSKYYANPNDPYNVAIATLSDAQLAMLAQGQRVSLDEPRLAPYAEAYQRRFGKNAKATPYLALLPNDDDGLRPQQAGIYRLLLSGVDFYPESKGFAMEWAPLDPQK